MRMAFFAAALAAAAFAGPAAANCDSCSFKPMLEQGLESPKPTLEPRNGHHARGKHVGCEGGCNASPLKPDERDLKPGKPRVAGCESCNFKPAEDQDADLIASRRG